MNFTKVEDLKVGDKVRLLAEDWNKLKNSVLALLAPDDLCTISYVITGRGARALFRIASCEYYVDNTRWRCIKVEDAEQVKAEEEWQYQVVRNGRPILAWFSLEKAKKEVQSLVDAGYRAQDIQVYKRTKVDFSVEVKETVTVKKTVVF